MNKNYLLAAIMSCLMLTACSKKVEHNAEEANAAAEDAITAADAAQATEATAHEPDATPFTEQKPTQILNPSHNPAELGRRMVRQAEVDFSAQDVVKTTLAIDKLTLEAGGFVEQKNIHFQVLDVEQQKLADGKIKLFEKVSPQAQMIVRIPSANAADFVNQLLPLMYFLNQQQYSAKRFELQLLEEKLAQTQNVPSETKNAQLNEIARLTQMEVQDRVRFSTLTIQINQPTLVRERIDIDLAAVARLNGDSFWKRAWNGVQYGWQFVLDLLVLLITIWPLYLIGMIVLLLYKLLKPVIQRFSK